MNVLTCRNIVLDITNIPICTSTRAHSRAWPMPYNCSRTNFFHPQSDVGVGGRITSLEKLRPLSRSVQSHMVGSTMNDPYISHAPNATPTRRHGGKGNDRFRALAKSPRYTNTRMPSMALIQAVAQDQSVLLLRRLLPTAELQFQ